MSGTVDGLSRELEPIRALRKHFGGYESSGCHADLSVAAENLLPAVGLLLEKGFFLEDITGVDVNEGILLVYHFDRYEASSRVMLRLMVPHEERKAPSIAPIYSGAEWHERECFDFFGVVFENNPNLKPLLLPDDMKVHPLVKEKGRRSIYGLLPLDRIVQQGSSGSEGAEANSSSERRSRE